MSTERAPKAADDFKVIKGIGPATERRLHQAGILTYTQLAASAPTVLANVFEGMIGMSVERIVQENWIGQAQSLLSEPALAESQPETLPGNGQHYATFTIELLLDDRNEVRRTRVAHVQGTSKDTWVGWHAERLVNFIVERADLHRPAQEIAAIPAAVEAAATPTPSAISTPAEPHHLHKLTLEPVDLNRMMLTQAEPVTPPSPERPAVPPAQPLTHSLRLQVIPVGAESPRGILHHDESFNVHLTLDLPDAAAAGNKPFNYKAIIYAEHLGGGPRQMVGERQGSTAPAKAFAIDVPGHIATPGTYRLEAEMSLSSTPSTAGWHTSLESSLLHVY